MGFADALRERMVPNAPTAGVAAGDGTAAGSAAAPRPITELLASNPEGLRFPPGFNPALTEGAAPAQAWEGWTYRPVDPSGMVNEITGPDGTKRYLTEVGRGAGEGLNALEGWRSGFFTNAPDDFNYDRPEFWAAAAEHYNRGEWVEPIAGQGRYEPRGPTLTAEQYREQFRPVYEEYRRGTSDSDALAGLLLPTWDATTGGYDVGTLGGNMSGRQFGGEAPNGQPIRGEMILTDYNPYASDVQSDDGGRYDFTAPRGNQGLDHLITLGPSIVMGAITYGAGLAAGGGGFADFLTKPFGLEGIAGQAASGALQGAASAAVSGGDIGKGILGGAVGGAAGGVTRTALAPHVASGAISQGVSNALSAGAAGAAGTVASGGDLQRGFAAALTSAAGSAASTAVGGGAAGQVAGGVARGLIGEALRPDAPQPQTAPTRIAPSNGTQQLTSNNTSANLKLGWMTRRN